VECLNDTSTYMHVIDSFDYLKGTILTEVDFGLPLLWKSMFA